MGDLFLQLAHYNHWANQRLYHSCEGLDPQAYYLDRQAFFTSIHGSLNHILLADRIWLGRFMGKPYGFNRLNDILYRDLPSLKQARIEQDQQIITYVAGLTADQMEGSITYTNSQGDPFIQPLWSCLSHFFNHQTHHRGQVHQMISEAGIDPPILDLIAMSRS